MIGRPDPVAALARQARRRLWAARLALAWERLWPALWPAVGIAGLFLVLALFDLAALVPGWLHAIVLAGFAVAFVVALARARGALTLADEAAARRRIERASGLRHRPLSALDDRPVAADPRSKALWTRHLRRLAAAAGRLRVGLPAPGLARSDPYGLRAVLLLFLVIAFTAAGGDGGRRVARAFQPDLSGLGGGGPVELTMWLTPPAYTGAAPLYLAAGAAAVAGTTKTTEITLPGGSEVVARVHGGRGLPRLRIDDRAIPFEAIDDTNFELRATIADGKRLAVTQAGETVADWPLTVIQDQPPRIEYAKPPGRTRRSALRLDYLAEDDYGLTSAKAEIRLAEGGDDSVLGFDLPLPGDGRDAVEGTSYNDLTPHPWAGLPVTITLSATDALGQIGRSETIAIVLPERIFNHPVARAIIELRKTLTRDPGKRAEVARGLAELARDPGQFFDDVTVFLGLRAAYWRLVYGRSATVVGEMQSLLWDLALTIEEGPLALAEQDLRAAQQALMEALDGDAPDEEINRLVDELRAALENYLDALREIAASKRDRDPSLEERMAETIERDQIIKMVERLRELARTGARDAARDLLAQLRDMLENLRASQMAGDQPSETSAGEQALRQLQKLIEGQQGLLDQTFRWSQSGEGGRSRGELSQSSAAAQESLRRALGAMMLKWGETGLAIPRPLGRAERSMRASRQALQQGLPGQAVTPQSSAVDALQRGGRAMLQDLVKQMRKGPRGEGGQFGMFDRNSDPLGRGIEGRGFQDDGRTKIPDEAELRRSREILDELYRRANQFRRPPLERDYIRRLLRRF